MNVLRISLYLAGPNDPKISFRVFSLPVNEYPWVASMILLKKGDCAGVIKKLLVIHGANQRKQSVVLLFDEKLQINFLVWDLGQQSAST